MDFFLLTFPCGCVLDPNALATSCDGQVCECSWCGAIFVAAELSEWFNCGGDVDRSAFRVGRGPRALLRYGKHLLEVMGGCHCGSVLVRVHRRQAVIHLTAPATAVELLRN